MTLGVVEVGPSFRSNRCPRLVPDAQVEGPYRPSQVEGGEARVLGHFAGVDRDVRDQQLPPAP